LPAPGNSRHGRAISDQLELTKGHGLEERGDLSEASATAGASNDQRQDPAELTLLDGDGYAVPTGYVGGKAEQQERNQARLESCDKGPRMVVMAKGVAGKPIIEVGEVLAGPPSASWYVGAYSFSYRSGRYLGVLTTTGAALPMPFHQICNSPAEARTMSRDTHRAFEAGLVPETGVYRRLNVKRRRRGPQGGSKL
jgi:hypothetical protein